MCILNRYFNSQQVDQIMAEYKHRALLCHPDKHPDDDGSQMKKFQELQVGSIVPTTFFSFKTFKYTCTISQLGS